MPPYSPVLLSPLSPHLMAPKTEVSKLPPLCPPSALGLKTYATHPLKPCRTTSALANRAYAAAGQAGSALHTMVVLQMLQAKLLCGMDESGQDSNTFKEQQMTGSVCNESNGAGNRQSMANLVVLECHLWLYLTEIRDPEKMAFLDSPVSPKGLLSSAMDSLQSTLLRHRCKCCIISYLSTPAKRLLC